MKSKLLLLLLLTLLGFASCNEKAKNGNAAKEPGKVSKQESKYGKPVIKPAIALKDLTNFLVYRQQYVKFYEDFTALDTASNIISKESFLKSLTTGIYLPLKLISKDSSIYYQLYTIDRSADKKISPVLKYWALEEYNNYKVEGTAFPDYRFVDMEGTLYNKEKTLVVKCWFVRCSPCIEEMPALNELKQKYKDKRDVLFVSLCLDSKKALPMQSFPNKNNLSRRI